MAVDASGGLTFVLDENLGGNVLSILRMARVQPEGMLTSLEELGFSAGHADEDWISALGRGAISGSDVPGLSKFEPDGATARPHQRRRRIIIASGISTADAKAAAPIRPTGVVRPVAVTVARLPSLNSTVPFISSGCVDGSLVGSRGCTVRPPADRSSGWSGR
jgi:hypothetical protein